MNTAPTTYVIRVDGHLDDHWSTWLGEPDMTREDDGTTTITASIADQAQLHGVLAGLRDIGAIITELRTTNSRQSTNGSPAAPPTSTATTRWLDTVGYAILKDECAPSRTAPVQASHMGRPPTRRDYSGSLVPSGVGARISASGRTS